MNGDLTGKGEKKKERRERGALLIGEEKGKLFRIFAIIRSSGLERNGGDGKGSNKK